MIFGVYYGGYIRYWRTYDYDDGMAHWTQDKRNRAKVENIAIAERTTKISFGGLLGIKGKLSKKLTWELSTGLGFSPPSLYVIRTEGTLKTESRPVGPNEAEAGDMFPGGYFNHLSLLGHISIGYSF